MPQQDVFIEVKAAGGGFVQTGERRYAIGRDLTHSIGSLSWSWDGQRLVARTCRYGLRPLFYCSQADRILLAPSILTLLRRGASRALDEAALAVFARFGSFLGEDTPFRAIKLLPPGGRLSWDGMLSIAREKFENEPRTMRRDEAVQRYATLFREAVARCAGAQSLVPLSGGRDSRHIAFEARRLGRLARCFTLHYDPTKPDEDFEIAKLVARALGVAHEAIVQSGDRAAKERRTALACSLATNGHYWLLPLDQRLAGATSPASPLLDGLGGDVLSNGLFLDATRLGLYRAGRLDALADRLLSEGASRLSYMKHPDRLPLATARDRLVLELARHRKAPNPVASFFFWNRTRRCIAPAVFGLLGAHRVHCPYLDPAVFDFLLGLPPELFLDHRFHDETIHTAFPEHAAIPFETKPLQRPRSLWHLRTYAARLMRRLLLRRSGGLLDRRYCVGRLGHMLATGSSRFFWLAQSVSYFSVLEEVTELGVENEPRPRLERPAVLPPPLLPAAGQ